MQPQLERYACAAGGAAFVIVWATLGFTTALLAVVAAAAAAQAPALPRRALRRRRPARPAPRARRRRDDAAELPLVPDDPSLVLSYPQP